MGGTTYTVYNTIGGMLICNIVVIIRGWYRFQSSDHIKFMGMNMPREFLYIIPSGVCTAVIIPTTTLMYVLPISVMVAMIIMRASVIIISRIVDAIQIKQGILHKVVYWEENVAVAFALLAVSIKFYYVRPGDFDFINNAAAMTILTFYLIAYSIRIYIFNYYKNTRKPGAIYDTKGFFAVERISSTTAIILAGLIYFYSVNPDGSRCQDFRLPVQGRAHQRRNCGGKACFPAYVRLRGFFSVFLFMFKGPHRHLRRACKPADFAGGRHRRHAVRLVADSRTKPQGRGLAWPGGDLRRHLLHGQSRKTRLRTG